MGFSFFLWNVCVVSNRWVLGTVLKIELGIPFDVHVGFYLLLRLIVESDFGNLRGDEL